MEKDEITPFEVRAAVAEAGYFPMETPFDKFPMDFVRGVLIADWETVKNKCLAIRQKMPF